MRAGRLLILASILWIPGTVRAQELLPQAENLTGLTGVRVFFQVHLGSDTWNAQAAQDLTSRLELALREEGIGVSDAASDRLCFLVSSVLSQGGLMAYQATLRLEQLGIVRQRYEVVVTWTKSIVGMRSATGVRLALRDDLESLAADFLNDYLTANPKGR
jgi:hypothetical protein